MHGFLNLGNTCYFNSALQCLFHAIPITEHIYKTEYSGECEFTRLYKNLVQQYFNIQESGCFNVAPLLKEFRKTFPRFVEHEPHDTQDALFCIIDILERSFPEIKKLVYGEKRQITISPVGKNTVDTPFSIQTLNINQQKCKVSELLTESMKWHTLTDYVDDEGNKHNVTTTRTLFKSFPPVMFISFDKKSNIILEHEITFDDKLIYDLQSYAIHKGAQYGGHYTSAAKFQDVWVAHDDENLYRTQPREVDGYYLLTYILRSP